VPDSFGAATVAPRRGLARVLTWRKTLLLVTAAAALLMSPLALAPDPTLSADTGTWVMAIASPAASPAATPMPTPPLTGGSSPASSFPADAALSDSPNLARGVPVVRIALALEPPIPTIERAYAIPLGGSVAAPAIPAGVAPPVSGAVGSSAELPRPVVVARIVPTSLAGAGSSGGSSGGGGSGGGGGGGGGGTPVVGGGGWNSAVASWYGPGFYGHRTACGQTYTESSWGVAHKSLPCGTIIVFNSGGRIVSAPVIDRGPYVGGRTWDLSAALCRALNHCWTGGILWRFG
jgi:peptidoglycan lytic transglycosylase